MNVLSHAASRPRAHICTFQRGFHKEAFCRLAGPGPNGLKLAVLIFKHVGHVMKASDPNPMPPIATLVASQRAALGEGAQFNGPYIM